MEQVEYRVSGSENKVRELDQSDNDNGKIQRQYKWNMQDLWNNIKRPNL
jgi:hypothetical protein